MMSQNHKQVYMSSTWSVNELQEKDWILSLQDRHTNEINHILALIEKNNIAVNDFCLPLNLANLIIELKKRVEHGVGFQLLRGIPINYKNYNMYKTLLEIIAKEFGEMLPQNVKQEKIVDIINTNIDPTKARGYLTNLELLFHTDACDIAFLMCLQAAKQGGLSLIASSSNIYNIILNEEASLINAGFEPANIENREANNPNQNFSLPIYHLSENKLYSRIAPGYTLSATDKDKKQIIDNRQQTLMIKIQDIARRENVCLQFKLQKGDILILNNNAVYHGRTPFIDDENETKRHLLRVWIDKKNHSNVYSPIF